MNKLTKKSIVVTAALLLTLGGSAIGAAPASAATAGINMVDACHHLVSSLAVPIHSTTAVSWRCQVGGTIYGMNLDLWCQYKHNVNAFASYSNFNDPYSWRCNY